MNGDLPEVRMAFDVHQIRNAIGFSLSADESNSKFVAPMFLSLVASERSVCSAEYA